jgi:putative hydrolase of HD superfamily
MIKMTDRLESQIQFLIEIDKIKHVFRKTKLFNKSRFENDAEHAWHLGLMAMVLAEYSNKQIDVSKVIWETVQQIFMEAKESGEII